MNITKKYLQSIIQKTCDDFDWYNIIYAGIVGSSLVTLRNRDVDVVIVTSATPTNPSLIHPQQHVSLLGFMRYWLNYEKHMKKQIEIELHKKYQFL